MTRSIRRSRPVSARSASVVSDWPGRTSPSASSRSVAADASGHTVEHAQVVTDGDGATSCTISVPTPRWVSRSALIVRST